jgi:hypothetical protein
MKLVWGGLQAYDIFILAKDISIGLKLPRTLLEDPSQLFIWSGYWTWTCTYVLWPFFIVFRKEALKRFIQSCFKLRRDDIGVQFVGFLTIISWIMIGNSILST